MALLYCQIDDFCEKIKDFLIFNYTFKLEKVSAIYLKILIDYIQKIVSNFSDKKRNLALLYLLCISVNYTAYKPAYQRKLELIFSIVQ